MKILVTGGPVHAKLDAVKFVTNRFKGGLMAKLADELREKGAEVTYLCPEGSREPLSPGLSMNNPGWDKPIQVVYHDGFWDYREKVENMAIDFDAIVLGAAVANLIPVSYFKYHSIVGGRHELCDSRTADGNEVSLPLTGKFPSHDYEPGDRFFMEWQIAPRIIDDVRMYMKKGANLFGFKLLSGASRGELVTAAYGVLLGSGSTNVFANDVQDLGVCIGVGKDRSEREIQRDGLAEEIIKLSSDNYYATDVSAPLTEKSMKQLEEELWKIPEKHRFVESPEGFVYGTVAYRAVEGFVTTKRGKDETAGVVIVNDVDHKKRMIKTTGGKATLNAPLLAWIFSQNQKVETICHYHEQVDGLPTFPWAPPGTTRDSKHNVSTSFNVEGHGCYLLRDKTGKQI